jgi:hypothetical protein
MAGCSPSPGMTEGAVPPRRWWFTRAGARSRCGCAVSSYRRACPARVRCLCRRPSRLSWLPARESQAGRRGDRPAGPAVRCPAAAAAEVAPQGYWLWQVYPRLIGTVGHAVVRVQLWYHPRIEGAGQMLITESTGRSFVPRPWPVRAGAWSIDPDPRSVGPRMGRSGGHRLAPRWAYLIGQRGSAADDRPARRYCGQHDWPMAAGKIGRCRGPRSGTMARLVAQNGNR